MHVHQPQKICCSMLVRHELSCRATRKVRPVYDLTPPPPPLLPCAWSMAVTSDMVPLVPPSPPTVIHHLSSHRDSFKICQIMSFLCPNPPIVWFSLRVRAKVLAMAPKAPHDVPPLDLSHSPPQTPALLAVLCVCWHIPSPGPLHQLFSLRGTFDQFPHSKILCKSDLSEATLSAFPHSMLPPATSLLRPLTLDFLFSIVMMTSYVIYILPCYCLFSVFSHEHEALCGHVSLAFCTSMQPQCLELWHIVGAQKTGLNSHACTR